MDPCLLFPLSFYSNVSESYAFICRPLPPPVIETPSESPSEQPWDSSQTQDAPVVPPQGGAGSSVSAGVLARGPVCGLREAGDSVWRTDLCTVIARTAATTTCR